MPEEKKIGFRQSVVWNSAGSAVYMLFQWLQTYSVVLLLGYTDAGVFSLAMSVATIFSCISLYSMRNYQTSDVAGEYSHSVYLASRCVTCFVSVALCIVFSVVNNYALYQLACVIVYMLYKAIEALSDVYQGMLQRCDRMDVVGKSFIMRGTFGYMGFLAAIMLAGDLLLAITIMSLVSLIVVMGYDHVQARRMTGPFSDVNLSLVRRLLVVCLPLAIYGLFLNGAGLMPRYFVEHTCGAEALGYFTSVALPAVVVQACAGFVLTPLVTPLAKLLDDGDGRGLKQLFVKALAALVALSLVAAIGFLLFGEQFLVLLYGSSISSYTYLLMPLVACTVLTALAWYLAAVMTVFRRIKDLMLWSAAAFAIVVFSCSPMITMIGMMGAALSQIAALSLFCIGCMVGIANSFARLNLTKH